MLVSATVHPGTPESAMHHPNEPGIACRSVLRIYNPPDAGELLMSRPSERYLPIASHDRVPPRFHVAEYVTPFLFQRIIRASNRFSLPLLSRSRRPSSSPPSRFFLLPDADSIASKEELSNLKEEERSSPLPSPFSF